MSPERNYMVQKTGSEILATRIWALFCFALVWYSYVLQIKQNLFSSPFLCFVFLCIGYNSYLLFLCEMKGSSNTTTYRWWNLKGLEHQLQNIALNHSSLKLTDFCFFRKKKKKKFHSWILSGFCDLSKIELCWWSCCLRFCFANESHYVLPHYPVW